MAGLMLVGADDSLKLEDLCKRNRREPVRTAFEKEFNFLLRAIPSREKGLDHELGLKLSNSLFALWNKYQEKLPVEYFAVQLLRVADLLYEAGLYHLARTHGYWKCLLTAGLVLEDRSTSEALEEYVSSGSVSEKMVLSLMRCEMGDAMCLYFMDIEKDVKLLEQSTRAMVLSILARLHAICHLALMREDRYWIAHNGFRYTFSLCRKMIAHNHILPTMEHLLWSVLAMESSVPLLAAKYLKFRTSFYIVITQCYNLLNYHNEAEIFARRALDKVNELAQLQHQSSSKPTSGSQLIFREATIKLEVLVFKRSVFESHKKLKLPFKFKFQPSVKNLLQLTPPRTTTEKLLAEMFSSASAQFLAILETLTDTSRRALDRGPPPKLAKIDQETLADVYMELFTAGVDLCLATLTARPRSGTSGSSSIMESAVKGKGLIPLEAMVKFVRMAHIYEQKDIMELVGENVIDATQESPDPLMVGRGKALQLMIAMELLVGLSKRISSAKASSKRGVSGGGRPRSTSVGRASLSIKEGSAGGVQTPRKGKVEGNGGSMGKGDASPQNERGKGSDSSQEGKGGKKAERTKGDGVPVSPKVKGEGKKKGGGKEEGEEGNKNNEESQTISPAEELYDVLVKVTHFLHFTLQSTPSLMEVDFDLLLDSLVICWEALRPALSSINTHNYHACKVFLTHPIGIQYMELLTELVAISHTLELWRVDPLLHGELCLKLCCLLECQTENRGVAPPILDGKLITFLGYNRSQLLDCRQELEEVLAFIKPARQIEGRREGGEGESDLEYSTSSLALLHAECVYALTRVQVKLASTIPPHDFFELYDKPSSLKSKVKERERRQQQREKLLSQLSSAEVVVPDIAGLKAAYGRSHYQQAMLLMLQATIMPGLTQAEKHKLMEESHNCLVQEEQWRADLSPGSSKLSFSSPLLPPPILLSATETIMAFSPPPLDPETSQQVAYFRLFGRVAAGSCVKVRESDRLFPGLGMEVPSEANCRLVVRGLQPNKDYVFAVAAYSSEGKLVGKAIGHTSRPFRTTISLPLLTAWAYCCQCAYTVGSTPIALKCSQVLWRYFVAEGDVSGGDAGKLQRYRLRECARDPSQATNLHFFVSSIFIAVDLILSQEGLWMDQLTAVGPLLPLQQDRLELARKLMVGVEVAGLLNNPQLCLQLVVRCYGILTPLVQHSVPCRAVVEMLMHCYVVLLEIPGGLLNTKLPGVTFTIHHMVAAMSFYVGKMLLSWNNKHLFSRFTESCRAVLLLTLSGAVATSKVPPIDLKVRPSSPDPLAQPSFLSSTDDPTTSNKLNAYSTSGPAVGQSNKKKKSRKKMHHLPDRIPDENKTQQFKALEAFVMKYHQPEEFDLSGGEDPVILHYVIVSYPSVAAHKEVLKFKRRPQYLEMLVHLVNMTLAKGHHDRVMEWLVEGFQWLSRRNEILLNPRITQRQADEQLVAKKGKLAKALFSTIPSKLDLKKSSYKALQTGPSLGSVKAAGSAGGKHGGDGAEHPTKSRDHLTGGTELPHAGKGKKTSHTASLISTRPPAAAIVKREPVLSGGREFYMRNSLRQSLAAELSSQIKITKEDLEAKSVYILIAKLPDMWRTHRCRKRLRSVCNEELPWRTQANLMQASCYLNQVLGRLRSESTEGTQNGSRLPRSGLGFESAGIIIDGVIPAFPETQAGVGNKGSVQRVVLQVTGESKPKMVGASFQIAEQQPSGNPMQTLILTDIRQLMACHMRAAVLAERGRLWTLLQNVARSLWNAINSLTLAASELSKDRSNWLTAAVYGLACKPLYAIADGLVELLGDCGVGESATPLISKVSSLTFTPGLDDANGVGVAAIRQVVFLALHALFANKHWEKVIALGLDFDDVTNHSWADQLVPVLRSAQARLSDRIASNTEPLQHDKLEPAAHLDPGPKGYDIYGGVGFSLRLVPKVYLDKNEVTKRLGLMRDQAPDSNKLTSQHVLVECRKLFQRYAASAALGEPPANAYPDGLGTCALNRAQLPLVGAAYDKAIKLLLGSKEKDLALQAMNELGDVMMLSGNTRMAKQWWLDGLGVVLGVKNPLMTWRKVMPITLKGCGMWACLLGAMMATKLLRYVYWKHLDVRIECALLAAALLKAVLVGYSLPYPTSDMAYANYDHAHSKGGGGPILFPGTDLFTDPFRCSPNHLLASLRWCCLELVNRGFTKKALPILWLYNHIAVVNCRAVQEAVTGKILHFRALTQLNLFSTAFHQLQELLSGSGLPQDSTHWTRPSESSMSLPKFQDHLPLSDPTNSKVMSAVIDKQLKPHLETLYGNLNVSRLAVARALFYIALVQTHSGPLQLSGASFGLASPSPAPPLTPQSTLSIPPVAEDSPISSRASTRESLYPPMPNTSKKSKAGIKMALVYAVERTLGVLTQQKEGDNGWECMEVRVRALLGLAQLAVGLQHSVSGYQLSLQALRLLQALEEGRAGGVASSLREMDLYVWMECRFWMVRSVVGLEVVPGGGSLLLEVGEHCEECGKHGEVVLVAEMRLAAAKHAMALLPCQLKAAQQHSQHCVELLNSLPELSHRAQLISSKATLVLADTTCISGINHTHSYEGTSMGEQMVEVFAGLVKTLKKQIAEEQVSSGAINAYQPRYSLLASVLLRLGHTHIMMAGQQATDRNDLIGKAQECFKEGLDVVQDSTQFDPCLSNELHFANGWCMATLPLYFKLDESISMLVKGGKMVVENGVDYRLASTFFLTLAELYSRRRSRATKRSDRRMSSIVDADLSSIGKAPVETKPGLELGGKDSYLAWCMVRSALKVTSARQALQGFASAANTHELTKPLSERVLQDLPDFVLLDLYPQCKSLETLVNIPVILPVESLLLSRQYRPKVKLNWFKIIGYYNRLVQRCSWQKVTLGFPHSDWGLQYNHTTPLMFTKTKAVHSFLFAHCNLFRSCVIPSLPQPISPPSMTGAIPNAPSVHREPHLVVGEMDVTVIWYATPVPSSLLSGKRAAADDADILPASDRITGYFAMNLKPVNFPAHSEPHVLGMETHMVHTSLKKLSALHERWKEMEKSVVGYLDAKTAMRPISRSPSKQKRAEKNIQPPEDLMKSIAKAVKEVAIFFDSKAKELPRIEPHAVPSLGRVLEPFTHTSLKGDAYFFLREILSPKL